MNKIFFITLIYLLSTQSFATVIDSSNLGFTIESKVSINAKANDAFGIFTKDMKKWWNLNHTFSGNPKSFFIDVKKDGGWYEVFPNGKGHATHAKVIFAELGKTVRLEGMSGPFQDIAGSQVISISFEQKEQTTLLIFKLAMTGYNPNGMAMYAIPVDRVWDEALNRFKEYIEKL